MKKKLFQLENQTNTLYKQLNSKFYSFSNKVSSVDDVKLYLNLLKEKFPDASHICYAYRLCNGFTILNEANISEYSVDSGEPRGSAGAPILRELQKSNLINTAIYVIRYFGGRKLGIPGLIEAYSKSAKTIIDSKELITWYPIVRIKLKYAYNLDSIIKNLINNYEAIIKEQIFKNSISSTIELDFFKMNDFIKKANNYSDLELQIIKN